jgi:glycosyltransferase involved in cell wall biosynthesis
MKTTNMNLVNNAVTVISTVIPAYNESHGIVFTVNSVADILKACGYDWEIIVVDDGSTDSTYAEICQLAKTDSRIKGISLSRNFGKENALLAGLQNATGAAIIIIDADLQHPPGFIPEMIAKWLSGAEIVHAVKTSRAQDAIGKKTAANFANYLISILGGINLKNASDFKLLDRKIVDIIVHQLPEKQRFFRGLTSWIGFNEEYIYFEVADRLGDKSKWSFWSLLELAITALISFSSHPLRIVTFLGGLTLILAFFIAGDAIVSLLSHKAVSGYTTIIICILLIGSFIMISLGIIGEYIAKIYDEVKNRPHYLVKNSVGFTRDN